MSTIPLHQRPAAMRPSNGRGPRILHRPDEPTAGDGWPSRAPGRLAACLLLGCQLGIADEAVPIATVFEHWLGDARKVRSCWRSERC